MPAQEVPAFSNIQYLNSDDGLSQSEVTCMLQDRQGFLWIGTRGGLNRYDGHSFKVFQNEIGNANSLINNSIESIFEDSKGNIWIGTKSNGLSCYDPEFDRFEHFQYQPQDTNSISGNRIISIAESENGDIWVGTWGNGLTIIDRENGTFSRWSGADNIGRIYRGKDGKMWLATSNGFFAFAPDGRLLYDHEGPFGTTALVNVVEDRKTGKIYLGTWSNGLIEFDPESRSLRQFLHQKDDPRSISSDNAYHIYQDLEDRIWIGTWGKGLNLFHPEEGAFTRYDLSGGRNGGSRELYQDILCVLQDRSGMLWMGTNGGGLCKIDEGVNQFRLLGNAPGAGGLPNEPVWSVLKDKDGVFWVGTKGNDSLHYSLDGKTFSRLKLPGQASSAKNGVRKLYQSPDGTLWFSSNYTLGKIVRTGDGYEPAPVLIRLEGEKEAARLRQVSTFYQTSDGAFWIGLQMQGLLRSKGNGRPEDQEYRSYSMTEASGSLKNNRISALLEDRQGRFWIGTYGGLHLYRPEQDDFLHYAKKQGDVRSLSSDIIIYLHEDRRGNLWIGTPNGLNMASPGPDQSLTFQCFQEQNGLPNNYIHAILEDKSGHLWISTNKGIAKFDPQERIFYNYDVHDGLQSNSFMEGTAFADEQGMFYFGGIYGVNQFHPDSIRNNLEAPPVVLTGLKVFNQEVRAGLPLNDHLILERSIEYTSSISLAYSENVFSLDFAALDFRAPSRNAYLYKMEGLEGEWNFASNQRSVTYTNLKPGAYTFMVKAAGNRESLNESVARLEIEVLPPWWATWQAYLLYLVVFMSLLLLYRYLIGRQNELEKKLELSRLEREKDMEVADMKTRFFTNITHELRTPLTLISGPLEELLERESLGHKSKNYLMTIRYQTNRLLGLVNQLLDFRKAESGHMQLQVAEGNFVHFAREVFLSFREMADQNAIDYRFETTHAEVPLYFDRDKMEIVLCNLLSNAFKYTPSHNRITLTIRWVGPVQDTHSPHLTEGCCEILVRDSGEGMPPDLVEKVFDRFYQVVNTDSVKLVGTGIGLALVKNIVELHKGQVQVRSEAGKGSAFTVRLPMGRTHFTDEQIIANFKNSEDQSHYRTVAPGLSFPPEPGRTRVGQDAGHLLIVEDNPEIRAFIRRIFDDRYTVSEAENGQQGLEVAVEQMPDLIISDVMMPVMDGLAFCKHIKEDDRTCHIPLVLLTARTSTVFQVQGYHSGADAYVTKPFLPSVLKAQVGSLLLGRQRLKEYFGKTITLQPTDVEITSQDEQFLHKVMQLVEDNLDNDNLSRDFLAQSMAMSPSTFYRKIKALTGLTINAFIRSIRLKRAAQLMRDSQLNISEIAYQVGFNDLKYFRGCFKEQFSMTPSEYIQNQDLMSEGSVQ